MILLLNNTTIEKMLILLNYQGYLHELGWLISWWPKLEGDELHNSDYMHVQFNSVYDYAEHLKFITFVVFLF